MIRGGLVWPPRFSVRAEKTITYHPPFAVADRAMDLLYRRGGLKNPEIVKLMGIDYSTVSQGRKRLREKTGKNQQLQQILKSAEAKLSRLKI